MNTLSTRSLASGDLVRAQAQAELAIEYSPRFTEAWVNLGLVELERGNFRRARRHLEHAQALNEDLPAPHHGLGLVSEREHDFKDALSHYEDALKVDPGFAPARINAGRLHFRAGHYEGAKLHFHKLVEVAPNTLEGWLGLLECLFKLDRIDDVTGWLDLAERQTGPRPELLLYRARLLFSRGETLSARNLLLTLTIALERPYQSAAWAWLAAVELSLGNRYAAERAAISARGIEPDEAIGTYVLRMLEKTR